MIKFLYIGWFLFIGGNYEVRGLPFERLTYQINKGWNFIHYPLLEDNSVEEVFFDVRRDIELIFSHEDGWKSYQYGRHLNSLIMLKPGMGIWVKSNKNIVWDFDGSGFVHG